MTINNMPPAVMWGDYWMMSKFDSAMVGIGFGIGPDPDANDFFSSKSIGAKGGTGQNTDAVQQPRGRQAAGGGRVDRRPGQAQGDLPARCRRSSATICPTCRSSSTRCVEGIKDGLQGFTPNVAVQANCWNAGQWYWAA